MSLSKLMKIDNKWKRVSLNPEEMQQVLENLVEFNANEFKRCMDIAEKMDKKDKLKITMALFDKQGLASYTAMSEALEGKVNELKDKMYGKNESNFNKELEKTEPKPMEKNEGTSSEQIKAIKEQIKEPPKDVVKEAPKPEPEQKVETVELEDEDSPEDVAEDVFGNEWNPEKGKFEEKKDD